ncbi:endolytic transglycosylase MltG [Candidatus Albibeggiatoa sp. nov. NOAA]|uniref:endolytic transglycosylase MltG n=1 Tax=Candidatus Albibeggiatoa sp. nov. NOAA TaxID=3162724 RepID=UPI0032F91EBF|nr:endolytic transglycosylase MltG [Thiotrichaceae bacterium]
MLKKLTLFLVFLILAVIGSGYYIYEYQLNKPLGLKAEITYEVKPRQTLTDIALNLMDRKLMNYPTALVWVWMARYKGQDVKIRQGHFLIPKSSTPQDFLDILLYAPSVQHKLALIEGWTFKKILSKIKQDENLKQTLGDLSTQQIMQKLGYENQHPEGRFFPDTYRFPKNTTDLQFLQRAYQMMQNTLDTEWENRQANLPLKSPYEALILASIVEKETGKAEERPQIASVFINRLNKNMKLQTDPTIIYALGEKYDGNIRSRDLKYKSPYNTYLNKGLPPTPIATPGKEAIHAVLNPADSDALFFVAKGDGSHYFSSTDKEHGCAVIRYQLKKHSSRYNQWCRRYKGCSACR